MSGFKQRLQRLQGNASKSAGAGINRSSTLSDEHEVAVTGADVVDGERLQRSTGAIAPSKEHGLSTSVSPSLDERWKRIGARLVSNTVGSFMIREMRYPLQYRHGHTELGRLLRLADGLRMMDPDLHPFHSVEQLCFIDTETTGLGHGAGNVPFMIGIGYYESDAYIVEQLFIRNPAEELAMLHYLSEALLRFTHLVSYNGKAFDWPIIHNRTVVNRIGFADLQPVHLDLLYPSRNLWKHTLPSCRLGTVEAMRLGVTRHDDIPGSLAPTLYFQYLATGDVQLMEGVFVHNEQDILSLVGLCIHFAGLLTGRVPYSSLDAEEQYRLGLWLGKVGEQERMEHIWELLCSRSIVEVGRYLNPMAEWYKKAGNFKRAVELWEQAVKLGERSSMPSVQPLIELAMYFEHRRKDYEQAMICAEKALELMSRRLALSRGNMRYRTEYDELRRRMDRLQRKYLRQGPSILL